MIETPEHLRESSRLPHPLLPPFFSDPSRSPFDRDERETVVIGERTRERMVIANSVPILDARGLRTVGCSETRPPYHVIRYRANIGHIVVTHRGEGRVFEGGEWKSLPPGRAYLSPPGVPHAFFAPSYETPWEFSWAFVAPQSDLPWSGRVSTILPADSEPLWASVSGLYRESVGPGELPLMAAWTELILLILRRTVGGGVRPDRLRPIWDDVERDLSHDWTLPELAGKACLSGGQFRTVCRQATGRSPMEHLVHLRMRHAAALLVSRDMSIEQVARAVGYANPFAFSTAFKRAHGVPPSRFRK